MCPSLTAPSHSVPSYSVPSHSVPSHSSELVPPSTEPVEVRTAEVDGQQAPAQLIVGGRLWLVRDACRRPVPAGPARERWRVRAGDGASGSVTVFELLCLGSGRWSLAPESV